MTWEYRVVHRREHLPGVEGAEDVFAIHEVYYDDTGKPTMVSTEASPIQAESMRGLQETRMLMAVACRKPVLEYSDIVKPKKKVRATASKP